MGSIMVNRHRPMRVVPTITTRVVILATGSILRCGRHYGGGQGASTCKPVKNAPYGDIFLRPGVFRGNFCETEVAFCPVLLRRGRTYRHTTADRGLSGGTICSADARTWRSQRPFRSFVSATRRLTGGDLPWRETGPWRWTCFLAACRAKAPVTQAR